MFLTLFLLKGELEGYTLGFRILCLAVECSLGMCGLIKQ